MKEFKDMSKQELSEEILSGDIKTISYLDQNDYIDKFSNRELEALFDKILEKMDAESTSEKLKNYLSYILDKYTLKKLKRQFFRKDELYSLLDEPYSDEPKLIELHIVRKENNKIINASKIFGLRFLTNLRKLKIASFEVFDLDINLLKNMKKIIELKFSFNKIKDIPIFPKIDHLKKLSLSSNNIEIINNLNNLRNLKELDLFRNEIKEISGLNDLISLKVLFLPHNQIIKIEGLNNLINLRHLRLDKNNIKKIEGLENLSELEFLELHRNKISKIEGLDKLKYLKKLNLRRNEIKEIEGLENLTFLEDLNLRNNQIKELKGLEKLINIKYIMLKENLIPEEFLKQFKASKYYVDYCQNKIKNNLIK